MIVDPHARGGGQRHLEARLAGSHLQEYRLGVKLAGLQRLQMATAECTVTRHTIIDDPAVQRTANFDAPRPVFCDERDLQGGQMRLLHVHQATADQPGHATLSILEAQAA